MTSSTPPTALTGRARARDQQVGVSRTLRLLPWAFAIFNVARLLDYLPTLWAVDSQHDTSQHSLLTWLSWTGANATMAAWLYEKNGGRFDCAVAINVANAAMCAATLAVVLAYRL